GEQVGIVVVVLLGVFVGDRRRRLVFPYETLDDQSLAHVGQLLLDVRVLVVSRLVRRGEEQVVQDHVLDELPFAVGCREIRARRAGQALDLLHHVGAGELLPAVGGDDLGHLRRGTARLGRGSGRRLLAGRLLRRR